MSDYQYYEEQGVERRAVEALADVRAGGDAEQRRCIGPGTQRRARGGTLLAAQDPAGRVAACDDRLIRGAEALGLVALRS